MHTVHQQIAIAVKAFRQTFCTDAVRGNLRLKIAVALSGMRLLAIRKLMISPFTSSFSHILTRGILSPSWKMLTASPDVEPATLPPTSLWMGQVRNPANQLVTDKDRLCHGDVGKMGAAAVIWVVSINISPGLISWAGCFVHF